MTPERVFDGAFIRADIFHPERKRLYVTFRQRLGQPGDFDTPRPVMTALQAGCAHMHVQSRLNDWYINADTALFERVAGVLAGEFDETLSIGFSMGGYGALRFAKALRTRHMLLISPQVSISKDVVRFDRRYREEGKRFDPVEGDLTRVACGVRGAVLLDPFRRLDLIHGAMIREIFPDLSVVRLPCGGHPATRALRQGGQLGWLQAQLLAGLPDLRAPGRMHRAVRRQSESYWRHMASLAAAHGRDGLAKSAAKQARTLGNGA